MKRILLAAILITGTAYANDCDDYKKKVAKYEKMGMSAGNLDMGAKYLNMSIQNKKEALYACFYSASDKMKIEDDIKDMEITRNNMIIEASKARQQELNVAKESSRRKY